MVEQRATMRVFSLILSCALLCACASERKAVAPPPTPIEVDANGLLSTSSSGVMQPQELIEEVRDLARAGRGARAMRLVSRNPDVTWLALSSPAQASNANLAELFDRATGCSEPKSGWAALVQARKADAKTFEEFDASFAAVLADLRAGELKPAVSALPIALPRGTAVQDAAALEAVRLEGLALLLAGEGRRAAEVLEAGARAAQRSNAYIGSHLWLLACAARDPETELEAARAAWTQAVTLGAALAGSGDGAGLCDPGFFERALRVHPPATDWPRDAHARLAQVADGWLGLAREDAASALAPECAAWTVIGAQMLARGAAEPALLAFSRAEALAADGRARGLLRLAQARALAKLGRIEASQTLATAQATDADQRVSRPALAWLGTLELKLGRPERAQVFLAKSLDGGDAISWPTRAQAEANLGIALLTIGDEAKGLESLHAAQARSEMERRPEELLQALQNELAWLESKGRQESAMPLRSRIEAAERL